MLLFNFKESNQDVLRSFNLLNAIQSNRLRLQNKLYFWNLPFLSIYKLVVSSGKDLKEFIINSKIRTDSFWREAAHVAYWHS